MSVKHPQLMGHKCDPFWCLKSSLYSAFPAHLCNQVQHMCWLHHPVPTSSELALSQLTCTPAQVLNAAHAWKLNAGSNATLNQQCSWSHQSTSQYTNCTQNKSTSPAWRLTTYCSLHKSPSRTQTCYPCSADQVIAPWDYRDQIKNRLPSIPALNVASSSKASWPTLICSPSQCTHAMC